MGLFCGRSIAFVIGSMLNGYWSAKRNRIVKLSHIGVVKRNTSPGPITLRTISVNKKLATQSCVLRGHSLSLKGIEGLMVLVSRNQPIAKAASGVPCIRVTKLE